MASLNLKQKYFIFTCSCKEEYYLPYSSIKLALQNNHNGRAIKIKEDEIFIYVKLTPFCDHCGISKTIDNVCIEKSLFFNYSYNDNNKQQIKEICKDCNGTKKYIGLFYIENCKSCS